MKPNIFIIGAGRSGTNMLRDSICRLKGFETWPCDEINYIWRHGNKTKSTDRFTAKEATPGVKKFIIRQFEKFRKAYGAEQVVEKTCANSLKVPFINAIFPGSKYIFIVRDGRDVVSSAKLRWTAPLDINYIMKKARYVPKSDIPYYALRYFGNRINKLFSKEKRLSFWGPVYPGMDKDAGNMSLVELSAKQWAQCVETAYDDLSALDTSQVHYLKYEDFVRNPLDEITKVARFLEADVSEEDLAASVKGVSVKSVGNYKAHLKGKDLDKVEAIVEPVMSRVYNQIEEVK